MRDIERTLGVAVHPLRFRGNLYVEGLPAWAEFDWLGKTVAAGDVAFEAYARIDRCAACNVNPETAERDLTLPRQHAAGVRPSRLRRLHACGEGRRTRRRRVDQAGLKPGTDAFEGEDYSSAAAAAAGAAGAASPLAASPLAASPEPLASLPRSPP